MRRDAIWYGLDRSGSREKNYCVRLETATASRSFLSFEIQVPSRRRGFVGVIIIIIDSSFNDSSTAVHHDASCARCPRRLNFFVMADDWPLDMIVSAAPAPCAASVASPPRYAVLVSTGALNPVHVGHFFVLRSARAALESRGYSVLGGFLSPSNDLYVGPKCKSLATRHFPGESRASLIDLVTSVDTDAGQWLQTGRWEMRQTDCWPDFPEVVGALSATLAAEPRLAHVLDAIRVFYACGTDHWNKCGGFDLLPSGVVVVPRAGEAPANTNDLAARLVYVSEPPPSSVAHLSSTRLRDALDAGGDLSEFLPPVAAAALRSMAAPPPPRRYIFISLSFLLRDLKTGALALDAEELERGLFFFGSKRFWIFPETEEQRAESASQGDKYLTMAQELKDLILAKEARAEVCWLKPDVLGEPDVAVFGDYHRASSWLQGIGYAALRLDPAWWHAQHPALACDVIENYSSGTHAYGPVIDLIRCSDARLVPVLMSADFL